MATLNDLAVLLEEKGSFQEALAFIEKALILKPEDSLYSNNWKRIKKKAEEIQQSYAGKVWSQLNDIQKQLLYLVNENKPSDWSDLIQQVRVEDAQLKESWEALIGCGALIYAEGQRVTVERSLLSYVRQEGFLLLLIADIIKNTSPRKKRPWVPSLAEFAWGATPQLDKSQGSAFHKAAYKRLQLCQDFDILATVFLPFYRATWKRILQEGNMAQEIVEVTRLLTIHLPSQTKSELWDYAYYAHLCKLTKEAEQVYIPYL